MQDGRRPGIPERFLVVDYELHVPCSTKQLPAVALVSSPFDSSALSVVITDMVVSIATPCRLEWLLCISEALVPPWCRPSDSNSDGVALQWLVSVLPPQ